VKTLVTGDAYLTRETLKRKRVMGSSKKRNLLFDREETLVANSGDPKKKNKS